MSAGAWDAQRAITRSESCNEIVKLETYSADAYAVLRASCDGHVLANGVWDFWADGEGDEDMAWRVEMPAEQLEAPRGAAAPLTHEAAIARLVEQDVARHGEAERAAAEAAHCGRTMGRALTELANRAELADRPDARLRAAANAALTAADWADLRKGG